jgi:uncharacterized protein YbaR (Trm112 family)
MTLSRQLIEILACPKCKGAISLDESQQQIICGACQIAFPIRDDIPVMLIDEAVPLEDAAKTAPSWTR